MNAQSAGNEYECPICGENDFSKATKVSLGWDAKENRPAWQWECASHQIYDRFVDWNDEQGLEFPCTAEQFHARAVEFADGDEAVIEALCEQGIGPNWRDD